MVVLVSFSLVALTKSMHPSDVTALLNPNAKGQKGKGKGKGRDRDKDKKQEKHSPMLLSPQSVSRLLHAMIDIPPVGHEKPEWHAALYTNTLFRTLVFENCLALLKSLAATDAAACKAFCQDVGPLFFTGFIDPLSGNGPIAKDAGVGTTRTSLLFACDCVEVCLEFLCGQERTHLEHFLCACLNAKDGRSNPIDMFAQKLEVCHLPPTFFSLLTTTSFHLHLSGL